MSLPLGSGKWGKKDSCWKIQFISYWFWVWSCFPSCLWNLYGSINPRSSTCIYAHLFISWPHMHVYEHVHSCAYRNMDVYKWRHRYIGRHQYIYEYMFINNCAHIHTRKNSEQYWIFRSSIWAALGIHPSLSLTNVVQFLTQVSRICPWFFKLRAVNANLALSLVRSSTI